MAGYETIVVHAPRLRPHDPAHPAGNKIRFYDRDRRHPGGVAILAEGDEAQVWKQSPEVKSAIAAGILREGPLPKDAKTGKPVETVDPDSLHALAGLSAGTIDALQPNGVTTVGELVEFVTTGEIDIKGNGIGEKRREEIIHALVEAGRIQPEED